MSLHNVRCFNVRSKIFLFSTASRLALGLTLLYVLWVPGVIFTRIKRPGREADRSPSSGAMVKNGVVIPPLPHMSLWQSALLLTHRGILPYLQVNVRIVHSRRL
jgi:hypothetical protein